MTLTARTPEPLTEDPFAGGNVEQVVVPDELDGERLVTAGATEQELVTLSEHYDTMDRAERRRLVLWLKRSTDDEVSAWLTQWREFVAQAEAEAALIDGTVEEVVARVQQAPDEERLDLAERTLAAEESLHEGEDVRSTLVEELQQIIDAEQERAAETPAATTEGAETPPSDGTPAEGSEGGGAEGSEPPPA